MERINKGLDKILINMMVKCMLNPENKDLYIGNLDLEQVKHFFVEMNEVEQGIENIFWKAYAIAESKYLEPQIEDIINNDSNDNTCPECDCKDYIQGVACPNCDYVEGV